MIFNTSEILHINHDINNQLGVALGYLDLLLLNTPELNQNMYIPYIHQGLMRATELAQDIASICKIKNNHTKPIV